MKRQLFYLLLILFACGLISNSNIYSQVGVLDYTKKITIRDQIITVERPQISSGAEKILEARDIELSTKVEESAKEVVLTAAKKQGIDISDQELSSAAQEIRSDILKERAILLKAKKVITLTQAPDSWGKRIPGSSGNIFYYDNFQGAFSGGIKLGGLTPNHGYFLSLNGKPSHPSNNLLSQSDGGQERYLDFSQITTDSVGNVSEKFAVDLQPGAYNVKLFVKDIDDWKIVLYNDILIFTIIEKPTN